jgi:hypothetical protein
MCGSMTVARAAQASEGESGEAAADEAADARHLSAG